MIRTNYFIITILLLFSLLSCEKDAEILDKNKENTEIANEQYQNTEDIIDGVVLVELSPELVDRLTGTKSDIITKSGNDALDTYMQEIGAKSMSRVIPYDAEFEVRHREHGLHLWYRIEFDKSKPATKVVGDLKGMEGIKYVENVSRIRRSDVVHSENFSFSSMPAETKAGECPYKRWTNPDPELYKQWNYNNDGNYAPGAIKGADINLFKAWDLIPSVGDKRVIVAVFDGGIDGTHRDLQESMWKDKDGSYGKNFTKQYTQIEPHYHGTHVAGTIAARNNNGLDVGGIAGGNGDKETGVRLMSCQIFGKDNNSRDSDTGEIMQAFQYAADKGAVIAQNSWNCGYGGDKESVKKGIDYFIKTAKCDLMQGGIVIFSAGNDNSENMIFPASEDNVIAVAGLQSNFHKTEGPKGSNYGSWVDISAPGGIITRVRRDDYKNDILSTSYSASGFQPTVYEGGTSMACPHVSGVAALVISKFGGPDFTNEKLKDILLRTASKEVYKYNKEYEGKLGAGLVDAYAALSQDEGKFPEAVTKVTTKPSAKSIVLEWVAVKDGDDITASKYNIYRSTSKITTDNPGTLTVVDAGRVNVGETIKTEIVGLQPETTYYFTIQAEDRWGHTSGVLSFEATTTKEVNIAPVLTVEGGNDIKVEQGKTASVTIKVTDKLGWDCTVDGAPAGITHTKNTDNIKLDITKDAPVGKHAIKVTVTNTANLSASETINVEVTAQGGTTPEDKTLSIVKPIDAVSLEVNGNKSINLGDFFNDSKGSTITYTVTSDNKSVADATVNVATLNVKAVGEGSCNITVTANNGKNETLSSSFKVTVSKNGSSTPDNEVLAKLTSASPVSDVLSVKINSRVNSCNLVIAGATGKVFVNKDLSFGSDAERNLNINVAKLAAGAYVLKVSSNGETFTQHFVKL